MSDLQIDVDSLDLDFTNKRFNEVTTKSIDNIDIDTLTYASDGFLYGVDTLSVSGTDLYKIDPSTGNRTFVVQLPGGVNGLHFGVVPEPATLLVLALGALAFATGRRK